MTKTTKQFKSIRHLLIALFLSLFTLSAVNAQMTAQWVQQAGTGGGTFGVSSDQAGNCYATGQITNPGLFDNLTITSGPNNIFIAKYDANGNVLWAKSAGGELLDQGNEIATDAQGNSYVTGYIQTNPLFSTATFDNITLTGHGDYDWFLAKYDADGNVVWATNGGSTGGDMGNGVTIDIAGNIIITGFFSNTMTYQNVTVTSAGIWDVFIAKFNPDGTLIWLKSAGGNQSDIGHRVVADHLGNFAVVGEFQKTATFGTNSVTSAGSTDAFVAKYNGNGTNLWVRRGGSSQGFNGDIANGVAVDGANNFYVTGEFASNATFDNLSISSTGPNAVDVFVAKYNKSGVIQWVHNGGGPEIDRGLAIDADASGDTWVSGFADSGPGVAFDTISLPPIGNEYIFLAKYNTAGSVLYVKQYAPGIGEDIDVTGGGCLFMGGGVSIGNQPEFDSIDLTFVDRNAFMGKFCESVSLPCNPPTGLLVQSVTANSAKIHWNAENSAISYLVEYRKSGVNIWKKKVVLPNLIKLKNLTPSTDYEYRVATICTGDTSDFSTIKTFTTAPFRLDENESVSLEVNAYPNPNTGHFTLEIGGFAGDVSVDIFDVNGKVIYHETGVASEEGKQKSISLPDSFHGLALIRISDGSQMISKTISVE